MQTLAVTTGCDVEESAKKKAGYYLPRRLIDAFEEVAERVNGKEKWQVVSAALLMLIEADDDTKNRYIRLVRDASGPGGDFASLIARLRGEDDGDSGPKRPREKKPLPKPK